MAPEVVMCETFRDHPYDYKADVWSRKYIKIDNQLNFLIIFFNFYLFFFDTGSWS